MQAIGHQHTVCRRQHTFTLESSDGHQLHRKQKAWQHQVLQLAMADAETLVEGLWQPCHLPFTSVIASFDLLQMESQQG